MARVEILVRKKRIGAIGEGMGWKRAIEGSKPAAARGMKTQLPNNEERKKAKAVEVAVYQKTRCPTWKNSAR